MPLLDLQQRGRELGRIRIGAQLERDGKTRPVKLDTFRLTTPSRPIASAVAGLFGGEPRPWSPREGAASEWEVLTGTDTLPVTIPPGHPLTQWHELWTGAGCERRCDGRTEQLTGDACRCPPPGEERSELAAQGRACKPTSRLSVMLPDAPDLGVWLLVTRGYHAALELAGTADLLHRAASAGSMLPATLRVEQRESRRPGRPVARYPVPVLELGATLRALAAGDAADPLPPAPPAPAAALTAGDRPQPDDDLEVDPELVASHASHASSRADVAELARRAELAGVLDELVTDHAGALEPLRELLRRRHRELAP